MNAWELHERIVCVALTAAAAVLFALGPRLPRARTLWLLLIAGGLANALVISLQPANVIHINVVHHYLGAKYRVPYAHFYECYNAALERPQVRMRDLEHPPAMWREDTRAQRAYSIDLLRAHGAFFDASWSLEALMQRATESGAVRAEAGGILARYLPDDEVEAFRRDVQFASAHLHGREFTTDYGFNGSPFYVLLRQLDPTLHRPFGRGTAWLNLTWQLGAIVVLVLLVGWALGQSGGSQLAMLALLLASWDFTGYALPGLVCSSVWIPVGVALLGWRRGRAAFVGVAVAWAGLIKLFPFLLLLPSWIGLGGGVIARTRRDPQAVRRWPLRRPLVTLAVGAATTLALGSLAMRSGHSWSEFGRKILAEFFSDGYLMNSVSLSQALLTLGIGISPWTHCLALVALLFLGFLFVHLPGEDPAALPRRLLILLSACGWLLHTWLNYYAITPLLLLPCLARRRPLLAGFGTLALAVATALPDFDHPALLSTSALHAVKVTPYLLLPAIFVAGELGAVYRTRSGRRVAVLLLVVAFVGTGVEAARQAAVRRLNAAGNAALDRGAPRVAVAKYRQVLRLAPHDAAALVNSGIALAASGDLEGAGRAFARAVAAAPRDSNALQNHALWLLQVGRLDAAAAALEGALRLDPFADGLWCDLGRVQQRQGRTEAAAAAFRRALELAPANPAARAFFSGVGP